MKRLILATVLAIALVFGLTACGCEHVWEEATCVAPKTCRECGKIEGEVVADAHMWEEATCTVAKTCTLCEATEGDALPHNLVEANYQTGEYCLDCGEVFGDPVVAEFERTGRSYQTVNLSDAHGKNYSHTTSKNRDTRETTGEVLVSWAVPMDLSAGADATAIDCYVPEGVLPKTIAYDNLQELMENVDGYQWRGIDADVKFSGQFYLLWGYEDYYSLAQFDKDAIMETFKEGNIEGMVIASFFAVEMNGEVYDQCMMVSIVLSTRGESEIATFYRVPEGYDGCVFSLIDSRVLADRGYTGDTSKFASYEDTNHGAGDVYFRLK